MGRAHEELIYPDLSGYTWVRDIDGEYWRVGAQNEKTGGVDWSRFEALSTATVYNINVKMEEIAGKLKRAEKGLGLLAHFPVEDKRVKSKRK